MSDEANKRKVHASSKNQTNALSVKKKSRSRQYKESDETDENKKKKLDWDKTKHLNLPASNNTKK